MFHEDHIYPEAEFKIGELKRHGYDDEKIDRFIANYNLIANLELLTDSENLAKNATPFDDWIKTRDASFRERHSIPEIDSYSLDCFDIFYEERSKIVAEILEKL